MIVPRSKNWAEVSAYHNKKWVRVQQSPLPDTKNVTLYSGEIPACGGLKTFTWSATGNDDLMSSTTDDP